MMNIHKTNKVEYSYNEDMPIGTRAEIINIETLKRIHSQLVDPSSSEYMTFMLKRPDKLKILEISTPIKECARPELSLTVDTIDDFKLIEKIFSHFMCNVTSLERIIKFLDLNSNLKIIKNQNESFFSKQKQFLYKNDL